MLGYNLGGGTFDVSILSIEAGFIDVIATEGDSRLGGNDFINNMVQYCTEDIKNRPGKEIKNDKSAMRRRFRSCE